MKVKNDRLEKDFQVGHWSRYDYDIGSRRLLFAKDGNVKVTAEVQIAGSTSAKSQSWLWAWANSNWPDDVMIDAKLVRSFGETNSIDELAQSYVRDADDDLEVLGWELSAVAVRICDALGAYRSPSAEGDARYYIIKGISWAG
ncbi:DUF6882 domain-containing protein [Mesorhizobium sp. M7D.F.Ca.US.005.01.1.1]|uniref:DUF6882 domain-containing protein n=1 Tax=Mesorhizobium sp. M7D.F.Ca.US.005.01.1.1 TaxID=2493678 RepID=UPI001FE1DD49|nr:DUF6882 domain-containing protein [Mesorhizobium sp. M7D.F.Ca.US.005.01.1.1]